MKKKLTTYGLMLMVIGLWGYIFLKIREATKGDGNASSSYIVKAPEMAEAEEDYELLLNYGSPFKAGKRSLGSGNSSSRTVSSSPSSYVVDEVLPFDETNMEPWPMVEFKGVVENKNRGNESFLLVIDGNSTILARGKEINGLRVVQNYTDSIMIKFRNEFKTIQRN